jgi:uncharacterized protein with PQ loop repeat
MALNRRIMTHDEIEIMVKKAAVTCFKIIMQHLSTGTEENHENISITYFWISGLKFKPGS